MNTLRQLFGTNSIIDVTRQFPELVLSPVMRADPAELGLPKQFDSTTLFEDALFGDYKCSREYGGFWVPDTKCEVVEHSHTLTRLENEVLFGCGTLCFDIDAPRKSNWELLTALAKTKRPWAVCETPNGYHVHCLGMYWLIGNDQTWASHWRTDYFYALNTLLEVGINPDTKHVLGSMLQCRCYVRLQPKPGAAYAWKDPIFVGLQTGLPILVDLDGYDWDYYPISLKSGTNYSDHAMIALNELMEFRRN